MKDIKKTFTTILTLFIFSCFISAQDFTGIAIYKTSSKIKMTMDSTEVSGTDQKALNDMVKKSMQKEYELRFNTTESIYKKIETLKKDDGSQGIEVIGLGSGTEGGLYKNIKDLTLVENRDLFGKLFLVSDTLEKYNWQLVDESRQVGEYLCYKAVYTKEHDGKHATTITAWYTPQIPVSNGPASYWGLPGLILEADNGRLSMICSKITLNPQEEIEIKAPTKGKKVNDETYKKIYNEKIMEMQEMYKSKRKKSKN
ncbi:GLPGLI family protein [uncultured Psychroserpens sp.]|uniref:GLPGLI family protein n=1 Tax=uncultured Psychroserpens sp. TaxID=255436 RepID=UPI00262E3C66|nr:GLPGLI family protein [uncultured Psychroserpens sp.]